MPISPSKSRDLAGEKCFFDGMEMIRNNRIEGPYGQDRTVKNIALPIQPLHISTIISNIYGSRQSLLI